MSISLRHVIQDQCDSSARQFVCFPYDCRKAATSVKDNLVCLNKEADRAARISNQTLRTVRDGQCYPICLRQSTLVGISIR